MTIARLSVAALLLCGAALAGCGARTGIPSDAGARLDATTARNACEAMGGRCQSPDLPCDADDVWAGYDRCGSLDNNSCCVPVRVGAP